MFRAFVCFIEGSEVSEKAVLNANLGIFLNSCRKWGIVCSDEFNNTRRLICLWGKHSKSMPKTSLRRNVLRHVVLTDDEKPFFEKCAFFFKNDEIREHFPFFPPVHVIESLPQLLSPEMFSGCVKYHRQLQYRKWIYQCVGARVVWRTSKGFGLVAESSMPKGHHLVEFTGKTYPQFVLKKKTFQTVLKDGISFGTRVIFPSIDPTTCAHYINHSCSPNLEFLEVVMDSHPIKTCVIGRLLVDVERGEEITANYSKDVLTIDDAEKCLCGSDSCLGYIATRESLLKLGLLEK